MSSVSSWIRRNWKDPIFSGTISGVLATTICSVAGFISVKFYSSFKKIPLRDLYDDFKTSTITVSVMYAVIAILLLLLILSIIFVKSQINRRLFKTRNTKVTAVIQYVHNGGGHYNGLPIDFHVQFDKSGDNILGVSGPMLSHWQTDEKNPQSPSKHMNYLNEQRELYSARINCSVDSKNFITLFFETTEQGNANWVRQDCLKLIGWDNNRWEISVVPIQVINKQVPVISFVWQKIP
jgi:hypothetical protein